MPGVEKTLEEGQKVLLLIQPLPTSNPVTSGVSFEEPFQNGFG